MKILALHGSPGSDKDFSFILENSDYKTGGHDWRIPNRYKEAQKNYEGEYDLVICYSWGCAEYLLSSEKIHTKNLVFISPYIFGKKAASPLTLFLMKMPFFKKKIKKGIKTFLHDSASPSEIPTKYEKEEENFIKVLPLAMKEKVQIEKDSNLLPSLSKITNFTVIWGKEDNISFKNEQIDPLLQKYPQIKFHTIENAGHALPWTHGQNLINIIKNN